MAKKSEKKKKKAAARGTNAPTATSKPRGELSMTKTQRQNFDSLIVKMKSDATKERRFILRLRFEMGFHAKKIIDDKQTFGPCSAEDIAGSLGFAPATVRQSIKFFSLMKSKGGNTQAGRKLVMGLIELDNPPSWRVMSQWSRQSDDKVRETWWKDILSGVALEDSFDKYLKAKGGETKRPRRPSKPDQAFSKIATMSDTMLVGLNTWVPRAVEDYAGIEDLPSKRKVQSAARESLTRLKKMQKAIGTAISSCEKVLE